MIATAIMLAELRAAGVSISCEGGRLIVEAPRGAVTSEKRAELASCKPELLLALELEHAANLPAAQYAAQNPVTGGPGKPATAGQDVPQSWAEWKAAALNRLFQEQGVTGQPSRITAATVRHGEGTGGDERRPEPTNLCLMKPPNYGRNGANAAMCG
jgi:hypothetical protein